ncbi:hypothetical protein [Cellulomonas septica]|uniref:Uncharacterized protein n=1 Tax=Cellulomonas septica TaxID=285080 RepID=A0ABX1K2A8_9CELL|nr:hypothetical protein [Cellulomonas septica]NKY40705.1 hypothetical protein [Cellulomonas septica]
MSTHLRTGMHDAIDGGSDDSPFTSHDLVGRIRRRRAVRTGARTAVGVGTAGAIAVVGVRLSDGRDDGGPSFGPAAPGAPAECGTDIAGYAAEHPDPDLSVGSGADAVSALGAYAVQRSRDSALSLGRYGGREIDLLVVRPLDDGGDPVSSAVRLLLASDDVVVGWAQVDGGGSDPGTSTSSVRDEKLWPDGGGATVIRTTPTVAGCDGSALPAGRYDLYAAPDVLYPDQPLLGVAGPWPVELLPTTDEVTGLPRAFPADRVPMPGGTVVSAERAAVGGWTVELAVEGDDRLDRAVAILQRNYERLEIGLGSTTATLTTADGWRVVVTRSTTSDGRDSLVYRVDEP